MKTFILLSAFCIYWATGDIGGEGHFKGFYDGDKHSDIKVKTRIIEKKIPVPYTVEKHVPYTVYKKVPYKVKVPVPQPYYVEKKIPYPVKEIVKVPYYVPKPYNVYKKIPYEVKVPVPRPVEVKVHVPKPYIVEKKVPKPIKVFVPQPYTVEKRVPYPVKVLVPVPHPYTVEKKVPYEVKVPVERPYIVHVPKPYPVHFEEHIPVEVEKPVPYEVKVPATSEPITPAPIPVKFPTNENEEYHHSTYPELNQMEHVIDRPVAAALTSPQNNWKEYEPTYAAQSPYTQQHNGYQGFQASTHDGHKGFTLSTHLNVGGPHKSAQQHNFGAHEQYSHHNFPSQYGHHHYPQLQSYEAQQHFVAQNHGYQGQVQFFTEADAQTNQAQLMKPYIGQSYEQNNAYKHGHYYALPTPNYGQVQNFPHQARANVQAYSQQNDAQSFAQQDVTFAQQGQNENQIFTQQEQSNGQQTNQQVIAQHGGQNSVQHAQLQPTQINAQQGHNNAHQAQTNAQTFSQQGENAQQGQNAQSFAQQGQNLQTYTSQQNNDQTNLAQSYNGQNVYGQNQQQTYQNQNQNQNDNVYFQQSIQQMQAGLLQSTYQQNSQEVQPASNYSYHNHPGLGQFSDDKGNAPSYEALVQLANFNKPTTKPSGQETTQQEELHSTKAVQQAPTNAPQQISHSQQVEIPEDYEQQYQYQSEYENYYGNQQQYYNPYQQHGEGVVAEEPEHVYYYQPEQQLEQLERPQQLRQAHQEQFQYEQVFSKESPSKHKPHNSHIQQTNGHGPPKHVKYTNVVLHPKPKKSAQKHHIELAMESRNEQQQIPMVTKVMDQIRNSQNEKSTDNQQQVKLESVQIEKPKVPLEKTTHTRYETKYVPNEYHEDGIEFSDGVYIQANAKGFDESATDPSKKAVKNKKVGRAPKSLNLQEGPWIANGWTPIEQ